MIQTEEKTCEREGCETSLPTERRRNKRFCSDKCYHAAWYAKNKPNWLGYGLKNLYGISEEQYNEMVSRQQGLCAICKEECKAKARLSVDHDHETGQIRDLICSNCNTILGMAADDPDRLEAAAAYLRRHTNP